MSDSDIAEYRGAAGLNFFNEDAPLRLWLSKRKTPESVVARLSDFGALCGGRLNELIENSHQDENLPRLERYDRWGKRIDLIRYCASQLEARRLVLASGVFSPVPFWEKMIKAYLLNQNGEGGVTCALGVCPSNPFRAINSNLEVERSSFRLEVRPPARSGGLKSRSDAHLAP